MSPSYNSDSSSNNTITGAINGVNTAFTLSAAPTVPSSLVLMVNGLVEHTSVRWQGGDESPFTPLIRDSRLQAGITRFQSQGIKR
jgi:hypothetical protein